MTMIRPCADLRNKYNEISKICHESKEPMFITKNGANDLVLLSDEAYAEIVREKAEIEEARIERLISEKFDKHYADFEEFQKDLYANIEIALKQIKNEEYSTMEEFCAEMEAKYDIKKTI